MSQPRTGLRWGFGVLVAVGLLGMPGGAWGQDAVGQADKASADAAISRVAGTVADFVLALSPFAAVASDAASAPALRTFAFQRQCAGPCELVAPVTLPSGAQIVGVELDAFDNDASGQVNVMLNRCLLGAAMCFNVTAVGTGLTATPGQTQIRTDVLLPHTVDNGTNVYFFQLTLSGGTNIVLTGLRVFYRLQVSPAPAVASFGDVPTSHPFFRFIEALKASGITGGCQANPPLFCPDAPLTRGQMATFLAIALGLHFAP